MLLCQGGDSWESLRDNRAPESDGPGCESWCCCLLAVVGRAHLPGLRVLSEKGRGWCHRPQPCPFLLAVFAFILVFVRLCHLWTQPGSCPDLLWPPDIPLTRWYNLLVLSHISSSRVHFWPALQRVLACSFLHLESSPLSCQHSFHKEHE